MLIIHGPHQFLFYALPPNSQLLFCEPGIGPLFEDFEGPIVPQGCVELKSLIKQNVLRIWFCGGSLLEKGVALLSVGCRPGFPLTSSWWVWPTFSRHCPLSSKQRHSLISATCTIFTQKILGECWDLNTVHLLQVPRVLSTLIHLSHELDDD